MSRHVANAGAFYAYVARGLGKVPGVGAAFVALIAYNAMQIGIYGLFGVAMGAFMADKVGITLDWYVVVPDRRRGHRRCSACCRSTSTRACSPCC